MNRVDPADLASSLLSGVVQQCAGIHPTAPAYCGATATAHCKKHVSSVTCGRRLQSVCRIGCQLRVEQPHSLKFITGQLCQRELTSLFITYALLFVSFLKEFLESFLLHFTQADGGKISVVVPEGFFCSPFRLECLQRYF